MMSASCRAVRLLPAKSTGLRAAGACAGSRADDAGGGFGIQLGQRDAQGEQASVPTTPCPPLPSMATRLPDGRGSPTRAWAISNR
jgi:hypothetical protein